MIVRTYLPCHETDSLNDCGLDDLLSWEDTPCHRIRALRVGVRPQVPSLVDHVVCDVTVTVNMLEEVGKKFGSDEEFEVGLLINISFAWTPTMNLVLTLGSVDGRLRINGEEPKLVHLRQLRCDDRGLFRWCLIAPW